MNSPFAWPGGKRQLAKTLLSLIPEHEIYVEVFAGSAKLLFAKPQSRCEIVNDLNGDVINFFRVAKHRPSALAELFDHELIHAERFRDLKRQTTPEDELHRALRFVYLAWYSFGAKGEHFASAVGATGQLDSKGIRMRRSLDTVRELLDATAARLRNVLIEQRSFEDILVRYDSPRTWFYLDPPYVSFQANGRYGPLAAEQRQKLFALLSDLRGSFLMSFDDHVEVRALSKRHGFKVRRVEVGYTLGSSARSRSKKAGEVLISNGSLKAAA